MDTGATYDMDPNYQSFLSYCHATPSKWVCMGNNNFAATLGYTYSPGDKVFKCYNVKHIPVLCVPIYSLYQHRHLPDCGYIANNQQNIVWFPELSLQVNNKVDGIVPYVVIGHHFQSLCCNYH